MRHLLLLIIILLSVGCSSRKSHPEQANEALHSALERSTPQRHFIPTPPPAHLTGEAQRLWLRDHYWDHFDFQDTTLLREIDTAELFSAMARYVAHVIGPADTAAMRSLMQRAAHSRPMLCYFSELAERLLYDPNSPLRSDELFIPVLEAEASSGWLTPYEQARPRDLLELVRQNRVGHPANDFRYTLEDGSSSTLYALKGPYTLLFISNPGCPMCRSLREEIGSSPMLSTMIERGTLRLLMLYPDSDLTEWHRHRKEIPQSWIYAYDRGGILQRERLYDLKAIPTLYLLDQHKRVLLKDVVDIALIEYTIDQME
uniref:DUF5106 domain-containing protein n=1 Tax=Alistipes sp. TaxID=1872444 RepID=UPI004056C173